MKKVIQGRNFFGRFRRERSRLLRWMLSLLPVLLLAVLLGSLPSSVAREAPPALPPPESGVLRISMLDVGQGDSFLLEAPNGRVVLIDAGPALSTELLLRQLERRGISTVDLLVSTHPHEDHIGGMPAVLERYKVRHYLDPGTTHTTPPFETLMLALTAHEVPARVGRQDQRLRLSESIVLDVLAPREPLIKDSRSDLNNNSVVLRLQYGLFSMLFTGDAEVEAETRLLGKVSQTTVLKVGHHGSASSSKTQFLGMLKPSLALASLGAHNDYGHPHPDTLANLRYAQVPVLRTDLEGQVRLTTDGQQLWVQTFTRESLQAEGSGDPVPARLLGPLGLEENSVPKATRHALQGLMAATLVKSGPFPWSKLEPRLNTPNLPEPEVRHAISPDQAPYLASRRSSKYHRRSCENVQGIATYNLVGYASKESAEKDHRVPARDCKP